LIETHKALEAEVSQLLSHAMDGLASLDAAMGIGEWSVKAELNDDSPMVGDHTSSASSAQESGAPSKRRRRGAGIFSSAKIEEPPEEPKKGEGKGQGNLTRVKSEKCLVADVSCNGCGRLKGISLDFWALGSEVKWAFASGRGL
jgi:hypothetical protein